MDLARRAVAEGVGAAFLLATVVGSGIMGERLAGGNVAIVLLANTLATGAGLAAGGVECPSGRRLDRQTDPGAGEVELGLRSVDKEHLTRPEVAVGQSQAMGLSQSASDGPP